jgi:hypothetical protein
MYLITEENGHAVITPLHEQEGDFAKWQWLDSDNGQPGAMNLVTIGDHSADARYLEGGRHLVINQKVVLDVQTMKQFRFDLIDYYVLQRLQNYHAGNSFVAQFSPGKTQMVFIGNRDNPENRMLYQYALVVIDFVNGTEYAVPFDRTDTRFFSIWDADQTWMNTYFQWTVDVDGKEHIQLRKFEKLPNWKGRWRRPEGYTEDTDYELMPVDTAMHSAFAQFVRDHIPVTGEKREAIPSYEGSTNGEPSCTLVNIAMDTPEGKLTVYSNPNDQKVTLTSPNSKLVQRLGKQFDAAMAEGKYQELFGRYQ